MPIHDDHLNQPFDQMFTIFSFTVLSCEFIPPCVDVIGRLEIFLLRTESNVYRPSTDKNQEKSSGFSSVVGLMNM